MSAPEPLDEQAFPAAEVRGGDRPEDYIPPFAEGGLVYGVKPDGTELGNPDACGQDCDCEEPE